VAKRGRKPKSAALKVLRGERSDRVPAAAVAAAPGEPSPPAWLDGTSPHDVEVLDEWHRLTAELRQLGTLHATDRALLDLYARTYRLTLKSEAAIIEHGFVIETVLGGCKANPAVASIGRSLNTLKAILAELHLTPSARARLGTATTAPPADPLADFLARKTRAQ